MKHKTKIITLIIVILLAGGCGGNDYIVDKKGKIVTSEITGQNLQKDIFCKPSDGTEVYKLYQKYEKQMKYELDELPECKNFKITSNKTSSLWQFLFVKPLAFTILKLGNLFKSWGMTKAYLGLSLIIIGLLIRFIILPFNIKSQKQSKILQEVMPQMQKIEKKYENRTDQEAMMMKAAEMQAIYKKYKVNPMLSCLLSLIQLPIFFAFLEAIYKIPTIYEGKIFGLNLGTTPTVGIFTNHEYGYLALVILIILTTYVSFKFTMKQSQTTATTTGAPDQMKTMLIFMTIFIGFASFSLPTAIAIYWVVTYAFIIIQTYVVNLISKYKEKKEVSKKKTSKSKIKEKLNLKEGMKYGKNK